jgi:hypothetical protein
MRRASIRRDGQHPYIRDFKHVFDFAAKASTIAPWPEQ